jgi:ribosomal protein L11 methyltransferase
LDRSPALDVTVERNSGASDLEDRLLAALDAFSPLAIQDRETGDGWRVYFTTPNERDRAAQALQDELGSELQDIASIDVPDEDWARRSQAALTAVRIGRLIVAPPWDHPHRSAAPTLPARPGEIVIEIDPSMGFGTGHHATTRLCLALLQQQHLENASVVDVGTGSGVLAIAASLLGAIEVVAIDHDADALANARENIKRNQATVTLRQVDLSSLESGQFDLALANLTSAVILRYSRALARLVKPGGAIILSGFSPGDVREVAEAFGIEPAEMTVEGEWAAMLVRVGGKLG